MKKWRIMVAIAMVATAAWASEPAVPDQTPDPVAALQQQIKDLMLQREQATAEMNEQYATLAQSERTEFDAVYAEMLESYEIQTLELMVQYFDLTGNTEQRLRAEESLAVLQAGPATGTPVTTSPDREAANTREAR
ncbi:MAG: hypothetical protein H6508_00100 [Calditrichaeota bacterium]|nr:hypothetical protein [Calditrichota bacterium]